MKRAFILTCILLFAGIFVFLIGCAVNQENVPEGDGNLMFTINEGMSQKTIQPLLDMKIATYDITGTSSVGSFKLSVGVNDAVPPVTVKPGTWTISVNAKNDDTVAVVIAQGSTSVVVQPKKITQASITVTPVVGTGTLTVDILWPKNVLSNPATSSVLAPITPGLSDPDDPVFVIDIPAATAKYDSKKTLKNGYYQFNVGLYKGTTEPANKLWGKTDIARIIAGETSSVTYTITSLNIGGVVPVITPKMDNPFTITLSGGKPYLLEGQTMTITAAVADENGVTIPPGDVDSYQWSIMGDSILGITGNSIVIPTNLPAINQQTGFYTLDLIITEGGVPSSASFDFEIVENTQKILFVSNRSAGGGTDQEIWAMDEDGTNLAQLTNNTVEDFDPAWSPDYSRIVFVSNRSGSVELWTMNADGSTAAPLVAAGLAGTEATPAWSPDGTKIAFVSNSSGKEQIWTINANGTGAAQLTTSTDGARDPAWSPDGTKIAYTFVSIADLDDVYVMNADGSGNTQITKNLFYFDGNPTWSPDGLRIAFASDQAGNRDVWSLVVDTDAAAPGLQPGNETQLTNGTTAIDGLPVWSPNGAQIAFVSDRTGNFEVFVMDADGNNETNRTNNAAVDTYPEW